MNPTLPALFLLAAGLAPAPPQEDPAPMARDGAPAEDPAPNGDRYERLVAAYDEAYRAWELAKRQAPDLRARKALRDAHPVKEHYPAFAELADAGEGRALLWMIDHLDDAGFEREQEGPLTVRLCERLAGRHAREPWFASDGLDALFGARRELGEPELESLLGGILVQPGVAPELAASVLYRLGQLLATRQDAAESGRGQAYYERLVRTYPDSDLAEVARGELFRLRNLRVGMVAPDFEAETYDGRAFRLSDYRGKVVVLEFWGFW